MEEVTMDISKPAKLSRKTNLFKYIHKKIKKIYSSIKYFLFKWPLFVLITLSLIIALILTYLSFRITVVSLDNSNYLSIINFSTKEIIVKVNGKSAILQTFESFNSGLDISNDLGINIFQNQIAMRDRVSLEKNKSTLVLNVYSDEYRFCFISADVTGLYYNNQPQDISNIKIINQTPQYNIRAEVDWERYEYLYPGRYSTSDLPASINKNLIGFYPIECTNLTETGKIHETIKLYRDFDSSKQREMLIQI